VSVDCGLVVDAVWLADLSADGVAVVAEGLVAAEVWLAAGSDDGVEVAVAVDDWLFWSAVGEAMVVVVVVVEVVVVPGWPELAVAVDWAVLGATDVLSGVADAEVVGVLAADDGADDDGEDPVLVQ